MPITIFFCYAREDEALLNKLKTHLRPLQREGLIDVWYDRDIQAGTEWEPEIKEHLNTAQIILLLVSPDFMNSDYCYSIEMKRALERHERGEAKVIPIILRPVYWRGKLLGKLQALPTDGKPVTGPDWHNLDTALYDVTDGIHNVIVQCTTSLITPLSVLLPHLSPNYSSPLSVEKLTLRHILTGHTGSIQSLAMSADGQTLVSGSSDGMIMVWNLSNGQAIYTLTGHTDWVSSVALSADRQILVSADDKTMIRVWNLSVGQTVRIFGGNSEDLIKVAISADGLTLASTGWSDKTIKVRNLSTGKIVHTLAGHTDAVGSIAISADGLTLVSGSHDKTIKVWNLSTDQAVYTLAEHTGAVTSVALSADGQVLVSASWDKTIKVWNLSTGKIVHTLAGHTDAVRSIAISADGLTLVSGSHDKTVKVWNLSTSQVVHTLTDHTDAVGSVAISADGLTLASASWGDETIKVWGA